VSPGPFRPSLERRRRRLLERAPPGPVRDLLARPGPPAATAARDVPFLALDLETTGLDPEAHEIVSAGWVAMDGLRVVLRSARHRLVRPAGAIPPSSAVLHRIGDDRAARGGAPAEVLAELLRALAGRVLVAHNAAVDLAFLEAACAAHLGGRVVVPVVDTLRLGRDALQAAGVPVEPGLLRLAALRHRFNLPRYRAHDALADALSAAELLLALVAARDPEGRVPLGRLLMAA
jgi:DNA polymerase-3 subunit epsilon